MSSDSGSVACAHLLLPFLVAFLVNSRKPLPHVGASDSSPESSFDEIYLRIIYLGKKSCHFHNYDVMKMTVIVDDARFRRKRISMSSDSGSVACAHLLHPKKKFFYAPSGLEPEAPTRGRNFRLLTRKTTLRVPMVGTCLTTRITTYKIRSARETGIVLHFF